MQSLKDLVGELYKSSFGSAPTAIACAPGRVEVLGNHTDYNEGYVLSCAIDKEIFVAAGRADGAVIHMVSSQYPDLPAAIGTVVPQKQNNWVNYPLGVYAAIKERGFTVAPFNLAVCGNVPLGAGLSSSAAFEVATALALCKLFSLTIDQTDIAKICQHAEHTFAGSKCGLLDQFSSIFGKKGQLLFIDFRTLDHRTVTIPDPEVCLVITISGVAHSLVQSAYNDRRNECNAAAEYFRKKDASVKTLRDISLKTLLAAQKNLDPLFFKRARHVVGEDERVLGGMELLKKGDLNAFGNLLFESQESSKLYFENSCPELDILVDISRSIKGVYGSRLTGGGFGGATLSFVKNDCRELFERTIKEQYHQKTGRDATVYSVHSSDGAGILKMQ